MTLNRSYVDWDIDAINKSGRPIPSSQVSPRSATIQAAVLFALGVIASFPMGLGLAVLGLLSYLYSCKLKPVFLVGNVLHPAAKLLPKETNEAAYRSRQTSQGGV